MHVDVDVDDRTVFGFPLETDRVDASLLALFHGKVRPKQVRLIFVQLEIVIVFLRLGLPSFSVDVELL